MFLVHVLTAYAVLNSVYLYRLTVTIALQPRRYGRRHIKKDICVAQ